jgi:hypothetical protein
VAAIEDVVGELEGEGKLDGGRSVAEVVGDEAARVLVAEFLEIPNDRADQVGSGFLVVLERDGSAALGVPRCDEGLVDDFAQGGLVDAPRARFL